MMLWRIHRWLKRTIQVANLSIVTRKRYLKSSKIQITWPWPDPFPKIVKMLSRIQQVNNENKSAFFILQNYSFYYLNISCFNCLSRVLLFGWTVYQVQLYIHFLDIFKKFFSYLMHFIILFIYFRAFQSYLWIDS